MFGSQETERKIIYIYIYILQVDIFWGKEMEMILTRTNEREIYFSEMILRAYFNLDFFIIIK